MRYFSYQRGIYRRFNNKKRLFNTGFFHFSASCHCGLQASCVKSAAWTCTRPALAVIISLLQHRRHFNGVGMPLNPELNTKKTPGPCFPAESCLVRCSTRASHRRAQPLDLRWEWMARTAAQAKPQRQTPNFANEHQTFGCQLGRQMDAVFFSPPSLPSAVRAQLLLRARVQLVLQQKEDKQIYLSSKKERLLLTPPPRHHHSSGNNQLLCWASVHY